MMHLVSLTRSITFLTRGSPLTFVVMNYLRIAAFSGRAIDCMNSCPLCSQFIELLQLNWEKLKCMMMHSGGIACSDLMTLLKLSLVEEHLHFSREHLELFTLETFPWMMVVVVVMTMMRMMMVTIMMVMRRRKKRS